jgi:hypothetical protein
MLTSNAEVNDEEPLPSLQPVPALEGGNDGSLHDAGEQRPDLGGGSEDGGTLAELLVLVPRSKYVLRGVRGMT